jgi:hypothetical protein
MTNLIDRGQIFRGKAVDDLAMIIQIRWFIEQGGCELTEEILAWFDHHTDLRTVYALAGTELGLQPRAERETAKAKA